MTTLTGMPVKCCGEKIIFGSWHRPTKTGLDYVGRIVIHIHGPTREGECKHCGTRYWHRRPCG